MPLGFSPKLAAVLLEFQVREAGFYFVIVDNCYLTFVVGKFNKILHVEGCMRMGYCLI